MGMVIGNLEPLTSILTLPASLHTAKEGGKALILHSVGLLRVILHGWKLLLRVVDSPKGIYAFELSHCIIETCTILFETYMFQKPLVSDIFVYKVLGYQLYS